MIIVPPHDAYDMTKLHIVREEMKKLGPPKIRAVLFDGVYWAIEGSHRLAAAYFLAIWPEIIPVSLDDIISDHDFPDLQSSCTVAHIIEYIGFEEPYDFSLIELP